MTFCFCIDDDTHVVVHDDVIHRDYSRVINKSGKKKKKTDGYKSLLGKILAKTQIQNFRVAIYQLIW